MAHFIRMIFLQQIIYNLPPQVRRTLQKDASHRFTTFPTADILTNEQYVAFLQRNGYANPTCRLPRKYLDDHD